MSIEIKIPKEITQYEAKFVGPFTLRQTVCVGICMPTCIGIYNGLSPLLGSNTAGYFCILPAGAAFLFGWYKPYGMKFEQFVRSAFINNVLAPNKRKYRTENLYDNIHKMILIERENIEKTSVKKEKVSLKNNQDMYVLRKRLNEKGGTVNGYNKFIGKY